MGFSILHTKERRATVTTAEARDIMAAINSPEPAGRDETIRRQFMSPVESEKGTESWSINHMARDQYTNAWGHILAIEAGWFAHDRAGFPGRDRLPPPTVDAIAPRPRAKQEVNSIFSESALEAHAI